MCWPRIKLRFQGQKLEKKGGSCEWNKGQAKGKVYLLGEQYNLFAVSCWVLPGMAGFAFVQKGFTQRDVGGQAEYHHLTSEIVPLTLYANRYQVQNLWISLYSDQYNGVRIAVVLDVLL